jgi:hypothetical protein
MEEDLEDMAMDTPTTIARQAMATVIIVTTTIP